MFRYISPGLFYAVMAPIAADTDHAGLRQLVASARDGVPMDPVDVTCDVFMGAPVAVATLMVAVPIAVATVKITAQVLPAAWGAGLLASETSTVVKQALG
tara:strand:- start:437 stop:736 length:300 start_codon:yes stop_codon:yes gene_type:complete